MATSKLKAQLTASVAQATAKGTTKVVAVNPAPPLSVDKAKVDRVAGKLSKEQAIPDIDQFPMLTEPDYVELLSNFHRLTIVKRFVEKQLELIKGEVEIGLMASDVTAVRWQDCVLKQGRGRTADKLSATRLVELGVAVETIAEATTEGREYTFPQIVLPKDGKLPQTLAELEAYLPEGWEQGAGY
jgi:hypothetical protein